MFYILFIISSFSAFISAQCPTGISVCHDTYRNDCGNEACIARIRSLVTNRNEFWFGNSYDRRCAGYDPDDTKNAECYEPELAETRVRKMSIAERVFGKNSNPVGRLNSFVEVKFQSLEGNFSACGAAFYRDYKVIDVFPDMQPVEPWYLRSQPEFKIFPQEPNTYYTIVVRDAGYGNIQGLYTDYPNTQEIIPWEAPKNFANHTNPQVIIVYKQTEEGIYVDGRTTNLMRVSKFKHSVDLNGFALDHDLIGPIAINWIPATLDEYSVEAARQGNIADNCIYFTKERLLQLNPLFIKENEIMNINSYVNVKYYQDEARFNICCRNYTYQRETITINPLDNEVTEPILIRKKPETIDIIPAYLEDRNGGNIFDSKYYALIVLNPEASSNAVATPERPMVNWLAVNGKGIGGSGVDFSSSDQVMSYFRPLPNPKSPPQILYYLLYEQGDGKMKDFTSIMKKYSDAKCTSDVRGRCLFRQEQFVKNLNLTLRGVSFTRTENDPFTRYVMVKQGQAEWNVCSFIPGYARPCPIISTEEDGTSTTSDGKASATQLSQSVLFIFSLFLIAFYGVR